MVDIQELGIIISLATGLGAPIALFLLARHTKALDAAAAKAEQAVTKDEWKEQKGHIYDRIEKLSETVGTIHAKLEEVASEVRFHDKRLNKINGFSS